MSDPSAAFMEDLGWTIELLAEAESTVDELLRAAGFEELPVEIGRRLKLKVRAIGVQRSSLEEIAEGKLG